MMPYNKSCQTGKIESTLCGCCSDCSSCCFAYFCFPCFEAQNWANSRGESCSCCHICMCPPGPWTRANIRRARGMDTGFCGDFCVYAFCPFCFATQNAREIKLIQSISSIPDQQTTTPVTNYAQPGQPGYPQQGYPQQGYPQQGYPQQGYPVPQTYDQPKEISPQKLEDSKDEE